jgi:CRP-like cAMP-binding protein
MRTVIYFLSDFNDEDVTWLVDAGHERRFAIGQTVVMRGQPADDLFIVLSGQIGIQNPDGTVSIRLGPGEVIGEISFVDSRPPSATVTTLEPSTVLAIPRPVLAQKLRDDVKFASRFYHAIAILLAYRLRDTSSRMTGKELDDSSLLDDNLTDKLFLAGQHFDRIVKSVREKGLSTPTQ